MQLSLFYPQGHGLTEIIFESSTSIEQDQKVLIRPLQRFSWQIKLKIDGRIPLTE